MSRYPMHPRLYNETRFQQDVCVTFPRAEGTFHGRPRTAHLARPHPPPPCPMEGDRLPPGRLPWAHRERIVPYRACTHCGLYRDRQVTDPR